MDKILIKLYIPMIEEKYDLWIPLNKRIYNVSELVLKAVNEVNGGHYKIDRMPRIV